MYFGDFEPGVIVYVPWNSNGIDGSSITRGTNGTIQVYKDGDATTEVTTGITDTEDFDGKTGAHLAKIDTSSDGTFYASGHAFQVILVGAVIDGKTINAWLGSFTLRLTSALMPTTAGRKLDVSTTGEAGLDFDNIKDASGAHTLTNIRVPVVTLTDTVTTYTGNTPQTGDAYAKVDTEIATLQTSVDDIPTNAELATALAGADDAVLAAIAALNNLSQANVRSAVGLATANLDTQLDALPTNTELGTALAALNDLSVSDVLAAVYEDAETLQDFLRLARAVLMGEVTGQPTTPAFKSADGGTTRVTATLDGSGNRSSVTVDPT